MPKPIIAVDIDDVIYPNVPSLIRYLDLNHKVKMTADDFVEYDIRKVWGGGPEEAEVIFKNYIRDSDIEIAPLKGAQETLHKLSKKYQVIIMSARDISSFPKTHRWITHHFPQIFKDVHLLGNKNDSLKFGSKAEVCKNLGVYCLVDDNLNAVTETNAIGVKTLLFGNYPWNQIDKLPEGVTRVNDWLEVLEYFDGQ
ncbi:MAG TPA: hypothetical protein VLF88_00295 [Candidatus Babeliales bacterium]|nr:hypothetical protein [Candidatus Babeliales bacterium]